MGGGGTIGGCGTFLLEQGGTMGGGNCRGL